MREFLQIFKISVIEMFYLVGFILLAGIILGIFEKLSNKNMQKSLGRRGILITAWLGTPIHEVGHALMCIIFRHRITKIKLLDVRSNNGVLGYVEHSYNPGSVYQRIGNLFIGLGPIFSGIGFMIISMYLLLPNSFDIVQGFLIQGASSGKLDENLVTSMIAASVLLFKSIFALSNISRISFWIYLIIVVCISSHIALSKEDMKGARDGFIVLFVLIFTASFVMRTLGISTAGFTEMILKYNTHLIVFLTVACLFSAFTLVVSSVCSVIFHQR